MKVDKLMFYYNDDETAHFEYSTKNEQWQLSWKGEDETAELLVKVVAPLLPQIAEMFNDLPECSWQREGEYDAEALLEDLCNEFDFGTLDGEKMMVAGLSSFVYWQD